MSVFNNFGPSSKSTQTVNYSDFVTEVQNGLVASVEIDGLEVSEDTDVVSGARPTVDRARLDDVVAD